MAGQSSDGFFKRLENALPGLVTDITQMPQSSLRSRAASGVRTNGFVLCVVFAQFGFSGESLDRQQTPRDGPVGYQARSGYETRRGDISPVCLAHKNHIRIASRIGSQLKHAHPRDAWKGSIIREEGSTAPC